MTLGLAFWASPEFKEVSAGVAIFLFGMFLLEEGFTAFTGGVLERLLRKTTDTIGKGLAFGMITTSIMQSSSLVSLITISFISAGMITLVAGIAIVFGANIGTTTGAWLVAGFGLKVKISAYAMPMLVFGIILRFQNSRSWRGLGSILAGLGFLFLGIHYMKEGFDTLGQGLDLRQFAMPGVAGLLVYTLFGTVATVIMQSSHATLVLILSALAADQITYTNALALAVGANIGTTITAILGAFSASIEGKRLAGAHLLFNLMTAAAALCLISPLAMLVDRLASIFGIAADDYTLKLAIFHTLFNLLGVVLMLPFVRRLAETLERWLPERQTEVVRAEYLNQAAAELPDTAVAVVRKEVWHLFESAFEVLAHGFQLHRSDIVSKARLSEVVRTGHERIEFDIDKVYEHKVKHLYGEIIAFIAHAQDRFPMPTMRSLFRLREAAASIVEAVKHVKHLQQSLMIHVYGSNPVMREEYDRLRLAMARALREAVQLQKHEGSELALLQLEEARELARAEVRDASDRIHGHLNEETITADMATSLLNDANSAEDSVIRVFDAVERLIATDVSHVIERMRGLENLGEEQVASANEASITGPDAAGPLDGAMEQR